MKFLPVLFCCLALFAGAVRGETVNGHSYISLAVWAKANGFSGFARNGGTEFILTNKTSRLVFQKDSVEAAINGVDVRLSYPIAKGGYISQLDADKTVRPLVFAQRPSAKKVTTICLDAGHGGKDVGYRVGHFWNARNEKTYTLALTLELKRQLQAAGFNVVLTRDGDTYPTRAERPDIANRRRADLFISLHFNSFPNNPSAVQGPETYCMTPAGAASSNDAEGAGAGSRAYPANRFDDKNLLLAYQVQKALVRGLGATDRSVRRARFEVLRSAEMPAVLIEGGYMSHPVEGKKIFTEDYRRQMAAAIVRAVVNYKKLADPAATTTVASTNKTSKVKTRR